MGRTKCSTAKTSRSEGKRLLSPKERLAVGVALEKTLRYGLSLTTSSVGLDVATALRILGCCARILGEPDVISASTLSAQPKRKREGWRRQLKRDLEG
jgi:hypothetical protein